MKILKPYEKQIELDIVGSNLYGRYSKISIEQTYNMIISDGWLVDYAGYKNVATISKGGQGRGIYSSSRFKHLIVVIDNGVYTVSNNLSFNKVANISTYSGDVFMAENNAGQIAICDKKSIYIYNYTTDTFSKATLDFNPSYIEFQDGYFIAATDRAEWRLSAPNNGLSWPAAPPNVGAFQTKPDECVACVRFPGKGNLLLIFGKTIVEMWTDTGRGIFPYQKNTFNNIDYGCVNAATIGTTENLVVWVGSNEKAGISIMYTNGDSVQKISSDGINFRLEKLKEPKNCYGFCFEQDGHYFYHVTWPADKFTLTYDFTTKRFFSLCDPNMNAHIAKRVSFFNGSYYFVSLVDGDLYELNTKYTTSNGAETPRIRICKNIRMPDASRFVVKNHSFTLEQGESSTLQRIDFSASTDGGASFSNYIDEPLNGLGNRPNLMQFIINGSANDWVPQFRFWGQGRFLATNGITTIRT